MLKFFAAFIGIALSIPLAGGAWVASASAASAADDKARLAQATAQCRADVKEEARFHEMSLYERHKRVKKCVQDRLAGH